MIANIITVSRMIFSVFLLVFSPSSLMFQALYILCGVTDVLDGFIARKLHTESETGAFLDSIADIFFAVAYAVKLLPFMSLPIWIWIWVTVIAIIKICGIILKSKKEHKFSIEHSFLNKLMGILIFLLPLSAHITDIKYGAVLVCIITTFTAIKELFNGNKL